jgi:hypothetical protein
MPNKQSLSYNMIAEEDTGASIGRIYQDIEYSDFTDGGSTAGTLTMTPTLPEGAFVIGTKVTVNTAFTGTVTLKVGKSSGEDEFTDGTTVSIGTADVVGESAEDPLEYLAAATTVYLYAAHSSDWTSVVAGQMRVEIFFIRTVAL